MFIATSTRTQAGATRILAQREAERRKIEDAKRREEERQRAAEIERQKALEAARPDPFVHYRTIIVHGVEKRSPRSIIAEVASRHGIKPADMIGPRRSRVLVAARDVAIREVADERPDMALTAIARVFRRDHTSILHSLKKTRKPGQAR